MKRRIIWTLLALVLAAPAVVAGSMAAGCCPFAACCDAGCEGCPFGS